uniref:Uncharacterized protein n=1 Tax=Solanum tuberosum TaxID=4113 RepID=M1E152_SOLTU
MLHKDVSPATRVDSAEERKRKGKGIKAHLKGEKKSETQSEDIVRVVVKRKRKLEEKTVKSKGTQKRARKSPAKKKKVTKPKVSEKEERVKKIVDEQPVKGPDPWAQNQRKEEEMTMEERIAKMEHQKMLNGRVFDTDIITKFEDNLWGPGTSHADDGVLQKLRDENVQLLKTNASLSEEVKAFNKQIIKAHEDADERMLLFMSTFSPLPPLS